MPHTEPFEKYAQEYDAWFDEHTAVYESELNAIRQAMPKEGIGSAVEIGSGTGRFAVPLGITLGVEPSGEMAKLARERGMDIISGVAENLPLPSNAFDTAIIIASICFVDNPLKALGEAFRVLHPGGRIIVGLIDGRSELGKFYQEKLSKCKYYRHARFYSFAEIRKKLAEVGFENTKVWQTLFKPFSEITEPEPVKEGFGAGSFLVIRAEKRMNL